MEKESLMDRILKLPDKTEIYIAGAGQYGLIIGNWLNQKNVNWLGYIDRKECGSQYGKTIYPYSYASKSAVFIVSSIEHSESIKADLKECGISDEKILPIQDQDDIYEMMESTIPLGQYTERIKRFKGIHNGKRCFVIGNGPSLLLSDLDKLTDECTFACNSIHALYSHTKWRPTYYFSTDPVNCKYIFESGNILDMLAHESIAIFVSAMSLLYDNGRNAPQNVYFQKTMYSPNQYDVQFSCDCSKQIFLGGTVSYNMLQMAVYMGFEEIILLGMDFSYSVEKKKNGTINKSDIINHNELIEKVDLQLADELKEKNGFEYLADVDLQLAGYVAAKKYADKHDLRIYNATRGGKLEVFERVDFDSLLK